MTYRRLCLVPVCALLLVACGGEVSVDAGLDSGNADASAPIDAHVEDSATGDASTMLDASAHEDASASEDASAPDASARDAATSDGGCGPISNDASAIGETCSADGDCPEGYTCQPFSGIVLQHRCEILCRTDCDCPGGLTCEPFTDKSGSWLQCS